MWVDLQDVIGSASLWPCQIRKLFWKRLLLSAFIYVNGCNPNILIDWAYIKLSVSKWIKTVKSIWVHNK